MILAFFLSWTTSSLLYSHTGLSKKIPQMNNFVVYEGFFASKAQNSTDIDGRRMHITAR